MSSKRTDDVGTNTPASVSVKGKNGKYIFANTTAQGKKGIFFRQIPLATGKEFKLRKFAKNTPRVNQSKSLILI